MKSKAKDTVRCIEVISKAVFELKSNIRNWSNRVIDFCPKGFDNVHIEIHDTTCDITVKGKSEVENYHYIVTIWELITWQDGYFYKPIFYEIDNEKRDVKKLLSLKYRIADQKWVSSAMLLCRNNRQISEEIINRYREIRYKGRKEGECVLPMNVFRQMIERLQKAGHTTRL